MGFLQYRWVDYIIIKLAGAGFLSGIFFSYMLMLTNFNLYKFGRDLSEPLLWVLFWGYGILCSVIIDFLVTKVQTRHLSIRAFLYIIAGFVIFLFFGFTMVTFISGLVGAFCSLIFYLGTILANRRSWLKYICAFVIPLILIIVMNIDFTVKKQWIEERTEWSYRASFDYFNGAHEIPIKVEEGQTITFSLDITNQNGGGHGSHVLNDKNNFIGMIEVDENTRSIKVEEKGTYRIIVTGDGLAGSIKASWKITQ